MTAGWRYSVIAPEYRLDSGFCGCVVGQLKTTLKSSVV